MSPANEAARASEVSGPDASTSASHPSASAATSAASRRSNVMRGCASTRPVIRCENRSRSTARAPPAGTAHSSAAASRYDPSVRSSAFSMPAALSGFVDFSELEHTSSARPPPRCTAVGTSGRISTKRT